MSEINEIIEDIEAAYTQSILKIYTAYTHSDDERIDKLRTRTKENYIFNSIEIILQPDEETDTMTVVFRSPSDLDRRARDKIMRRVAKINQEYINGFTQFLEVSNNKWFEPIGEISIKSILGIEKLNKTENPKVLYYNFKFPYELGDSTVNWLNVHLYNYRKILPGIIRYKKSFFERENEILASELINLKKKFSIEMETEVFHNYRRRIESIERRLKCSFEEYYLNYRNIYQYTDIFTIDLLNKKGYPIRVI
jgi:hypothetical protein